MMRLQKFLAVCGVASRRKAEEIIASGRVSVNGNIIREMGVSVDEEHDKVTLDGKTVKPEEKKRYIILNKPKGYITSMSDQFDRPDINALISEVKERVFPIGRLDYDTEGLLILTNDGEFANAVAHPKKSIDKVYIAKIKGTFSEEIADKLRSGVMIDGKVTSPAKVEIFNNSGNVSEVRVAIHEGRNRQVRKMFESVSCRVIDLRRTAVGGFMLGNLQRGSWRDFTEAELKLVDKYKR